MMKLKIIAAIVLCGIVTGCHAQVPPNPTAYTCPSSSGTAYTPLNQNSLATVLTYTDSKPASGVYCYVVQATVGVQVSLPSNIAGPFTLDGTQSVDLSWKEAITGTAPYGYIVSRAPATASTIVAPTLGTAPVIAARASGLFKLGGQVRGRVY